LSWRICASSSPFLNYADISARTGDSISRHTLEENADSMRSGPVRCVDVDFAGRVIASVGEDKMLKLREMDEHGVLKAINQR
jgi:hypothetical protein